MSWKQHICLFLWLRINSIFPFQDPGYSSQGPASMPTQQQYAAYQQAMQNTGYQDAGYYTATSSQDSYAQSQQQGTVYDYNTANQQQQQHGQMYSQATVYQ